MHRIRKVDLFPAHAPAAAPRYEGAERRSTSAADAGEGFVQVDVTDWLSGAAHAATGFEETRFGAARYAGGALVGRLKPREKLSFAGRFDALLEDRAGASKRQDTTLLGLVGWF
jgi:hypothetical protein